MEYSEIFSGLDADLSPEDPSINGDFAEQLRRIRTGDIDAAAQLVKRFEPELRIIARVKLNDPRLRRLVDSMDICQSILGNFFVRASAGQFDLTSPDQLRRLLYTMIRNKVTDHARRQKAVRRDMGRIIEQEVDSLRLAKVEDTPSQIVSAKELVEKVRQRLTVDELAIVERRMIGQEWDSIAVELGASPEAIRKKMTRAIDRVVKAIGLDD